MIQEVLAGSTHYPIKTTQDGRPCADFHPTIWGDYFLSSASQSHYNPESIEKMKQQVEKLKEEVKEMVMDSEEKPLQQTLELIDAIQRLGVAYHFESEIEKVIEKMHHKYYCSSGFFNKEGHQNDLYTVALWFRLLRQHGYYISPDAFNKFKDREGNNKFKETLKNDVVGMLSLYEAAQLRIRGEEILDGALAFTTTHLGSMVSNISSELAENVIWALKQPIRKNLPRLETRHYISLYPSQESHNHTLLKLAELDFNVLQALHQKEASNITWWWKNLDFARKLGYARDRVIEVYFWILGVFFEPQYSVGRQSLTKLLALIAVIDDTYDAHGTYEELILFTEAIKSWCHEAHIPTVEEYTSVGLVTTGALLITSTSYLGMCEDTATNKQVLDWLFSKPQILIASAITSRLNNDIRSHKFEQMRGHVASSVECYMKEHGVEEEEEAYKVLREEIENAWKDINQEFVRPANAVAKPLLERILNLSRVNEVTYRDDWASPTTRENCCSITLSNVVVHWRGLNVSYKSGGTNVYHVVAWSQLSSLNGLDCRPVNLHSGQHQNQAQNGVSLGSSTHSKVPQAYIYPCNLKHKRGKSKLIVSSTYISKRNGISTSIKYYQSSNPRCLPCIWCCESFSRLSSLHLG
ncbi:hypothetical protein FNV43_RR03989 [Rhamnella rubrinervis]|uniref:Uncharacterized protein n=1 Tax=Rhamnella rubrinervis TaxID=2594499 RepID=A0A8K0HJV3_9ROSA|nr:hypothetical protein FNV43_RR03989 [Rhamnella rubrinervis]